MMGKGFLIARLAILNAELTKARALLTELHGDYCEEPMEVWMEEGMPDPGHMNDLIARLDDAGEEIDNLVKNIKEAVDAKNRNYRG